MKRILFFITHKTLDYEHCELSFQSIHNQQSTSLVWDVMYIYNTHQEELPNETILALLDTYNLRQYTKDVKLFDYDPLSHKSLGQDIQNIMTYVSRHYQPEDRVLFMKSDLLLSKYYFQDIERLPATIPVYFTAPYVCAKKRVSNKEIVEYTMREKYVPSDKITLFTEDRYGPHGTDLATRKDVAITDESIKFFACYVIRDWSCHLISVSLFPLVNITKQSWGGVSLGHLAPYFHETQRSFVVHKYHDIVSENRSDVREGPVNKWLLS